ncbi:putative prenyl carboxy-lyase [Natrialba magadii ATCC 43099]|uniref:Carboxylyase-like protein n=1 Tax=Natrialba magadii (strain ATCC 43099 / DSM 3394 / CCM 3739 / CIP 104546 / IAM 13178 / JCM 8861 / NBRC 102185 / NCIMB 2190 / MS3) TaxID=547559 RepID=D3SW35_NATMM|nr:UbiD family decarboxylase [Natrialba magadii]ADD05696.1 putative prenyl carboxy-lyase [Natrialba magadii ATCC 43099]ELY29893.1 carboxylyase-like protein [Natrialba magadii ATCC 43099]
MTTPATTFREFLTVLENAGTLTEIETPVSWDLEASAITMAANAIDERIPVFESVEGNETAARLVGDPYRGPRGREFDHLARAFALPKPARQSGPAYYAQLIDRLESQREPTVVEPETAPCKEVVRTHTDAGSDPDLLEFPWPYIHQQDGGRYATLTTLVAPDPDGEWGRWSRHRAMIHGESRASVLFLAGEQLPNRYYYEYERRDEAMPVALTLGGGPAVTAASEMWIPVGRSEATFAGGLQESPVELVPCETSDLRVPASAELVIEGRILPEERLDEGPFGDYFGYVNGPRRSMPVLAVDAITHRERPYLPFCVEGSGVGDASNSTSSLQVAAAGPDATLGLRAAGYDVEMAAPWPYTERTVWVIATDRPYPGALHELANFIFTTWGMLHIDCFVFVDREVNPLDSRAVVEALALHADPATDFHQFGVERMPKVPLNIYQTPDEKGSAAVGTSKSKTAKAYIDALSDGDRPTQTIGNPEERRRARDLLAEAGVSGVSDVAGVAAETDTMGEPHHTTDRSDQSRTSRTQHHR